MKTKNIVLLLISLFSVVAITAFGLTKSGFVQQAIESGKNDERRGSIKWFVARAKEQKKTKVFVPPPEESYAEVTGLDDAAAHYTALLVEPVDQKAAILNDSHIITWNKLKVVEFISYPAKGCVQCSSGGLTVPDEMLPMDANEILVPTYGGSLVLEGIRLESRNKDFGESFSLSKRYLVFLAFDPTKAIGKLSLGPYGMFSVTPQDEIVPIIRGGTISRDLESKAGNSLTRFKDHLLTKRKINN